MSFEEAQQLPDNDWERDRFQRFIELQSALVGFDEALDILDRELPMPEFFCSSCLTRFELAELAYEHTCPRAPKIVARPLPGTGSIGRPRKTHCKRGHNMLETRRFDPKTGRSEGCSKCHQMMGERRYAARRAKKAV